jgi:hypothetical protein
VVLIRSRFDCFAQSEPSPSAQDTPATERACRSMPEARPLIRVNGWLSSFPWSMCLQYFIKVE